MNILGGSSIPALIVAIVCICLGADGLAAAAPANALAGAGAGTVLTADDADVWLQGFVPFALERGDVAGAVVVIVKDNKVLLKQGYGLADVARGRGVDADRTLFRVGSVSKLFTWTAVMQLVQQGRLDLDVDVNRYLDFRIPAYQGRPVTLRQLMTHTAGFDETEYMLVAKKPIVTANDLARVVRANLPKRIYAPGEIPAYSNYGATLAGYIVQRVSGTPFDDYVDRNILAPLGMRSSTFRQPLPSAVAADLSNGYDRGSAPPKHDTLIGVPPAGSLAATGQDMASFMIAQLNGGGALLSPSTTALFQNSPRTLISPLLNRSSLGWDQMQRNGRNVLFHGGDTEWFHSALWLFPTEHVGLFVALNSSGGPGATRIRRALFEGFADRYFPGPVFGARVDRADALAHADAVSGDYLTSRRSEATFVSLLNLFARTTVVHRTNGEVSVSTLKDLGGDPVWYREVRPYVWRSIGGQDLLAAKLVNGKVTMLSTNDATSVLLPEQALSNPRWLLPALEISLLVLAATVMMWPLAALVRALNGARFKLVGAAVISFRLVRLGALAVSALTLAWLLTLPAMAHDPSKLVYFHGLQVLSWIVYPAATLLAAWNLAIVWRRTPQWRMGWWARASGAGLLLSTLSLLWIGVVYHLIGYSPSY